VGAATISAREKQPWFFVTLSGFTTPGTIYRYDFTVPEEQRWSLYATVKPSGLDGEDFEATQVILVVGIILYYREIIFFVLNRFGTRAKTVPRCPCSSFATSQRNSMAPLLPSSTVRDCVLQYQFICLNRSLKVMAGSLSLLTHFSAQLCLHSCSTMVPFSRCLISVVAENSEKNGILVVA